MSTIRMNDGNDDCHMNEFRLDGKFHDVIVRVGERLFPCHRIVLASKMKYFRGMFSDDYSEAEKKEIELKYVNANDFERLLIYVYGGSVSVNEDNIFRLLKLGHYLGPRSLEESCAKYIIENKASFSLDSLLCIYMFANKMGNTVLTNGLAEWIAENFARLSKCEEFLFIPGNELLKIFLHPKLDKNPTIKLDFLTNWVKRHSEEDQELLSSLVNTLEIKDVSNDWILKTLIDIKSSVRKSDGENELPAQDVMDESLLAMEVGESDEGTTLPFWIVTQDTHKRDYTWEKELFGDEAYRFVDTLYDINIHRLDGNNSVRFVENISKNMNEYSKDIVANLDKINVKLVALGDVRYTIHHNLFDSDTKNYKHHIIMSAQNSSVKDRAALKSYDGETFDRFLFDSVDKNIITVTLNGTNIYIYNNIDFVMYNSERNQFFNAPTTSFKKTVAPNLLCHENTLYMVGGKHFSSFYPTTSNGRLKYNNVARSCDQTDGKLFQRYDVREGKWLQLPKLKYARSKSASCIYNNTLYLSGGDNLAYYKNYNVESFDIRAGAWSDFATPSPKPKSNHILRAYNDKLWFFGGIRPTDSLWTYDLTWYSYDLNENTWSDVFSLPSSYGKYKIHRIFDVVVNN